MPLSKEKKKMRKEKLKLRCRGSHFYKDQIILKVSRLLSGLMHIRTDNIKRGTRKRNGAMLVRKLRECHDFGPFGDLEAVIWIVVSASREISYNTKINERKIRSVIAYKRNRERKVKKEKWKGLEVPQERSVVEMGYS